MKLAILNGSPRGEKSNSKRMTTWMLSQQSLYPDLSIQEYMLFKINQHPAHLEAMKDADCYLMIFPLYVDSMPSIVKSFMELMSEHTDNYLNKPIYFIIHSGFPEMIQNLILKDYTSYFAKKIMHMAYKGTLIMAGSESLQMAPDQFFNKKLPIFHGLLKTISEGSSFDDDMSLKLSNCYQMSPFQQFIFTINPLKNFYWNMRLKKNHARKLVKAQPYKNLP